jgi:hypothetical protein
LVNLSSEILLLLYLVIQLLEKITDIGHIHLGTLAVSSPIPEVKIIDDQGKTLGRCEICINL